jgi:hypothetical protein
VVRLSLTGYPEHLLRRHLKHYLLLGQYLNIVDIPAAVGIGQRSRGAITRISDPG